MGPQEPCTVERWDRRVYSILSCLYTILGELAITTCRTPDLPCIKVQSKMRSSCRMLSDMMSSSSYSGNQGSSALRLPAAVDLEESSPVEKKERRVLVTVLLMEDDCLLPLMACRYMSLTPQSSQFLLPLF